MCSLRFITAIAAGILISAPIIVAENIDPYESGQQYGWSENTGWLNAEPDTGDGVQISATNLTGYIWAENIGWVNLSPDTYGGVVNDGEGSLSGYAWAENAGWINFNPLYGGVTIDADGYFDGWAWGENIGWIRFDAAQSWSVQVCIVTLEDLENFASFWLQSGDIPANLDGANSVDMADYSMFASWWKDYCPDGWQLK